MNLEKVSAVPTEILHEGDHQRLKQSLEMLASGEYLDSLAQNGLFTTKELVFLAHKHPAIKELMLEAQCMRDEIRQLQRTDAADKRGVDGVEKPIYSVKGEYVGSEQVYSDSLLALQLKANDPAKYSGAESRSGGGFVLNVNLGIQREDPKQVVEVEVKEAKDDRK